MSGRGHFSVPQGKRVLVVMKDGNHFVAKYKGHKARFLEFFDHAGVEIHLARTLSIYREPVR